MCKHKYRENGVIRNYGRTVARLRLDDQVSVVRFWAETKDFCLLRNVQTESEARPTSSLMGAGGKRPMHEGDHTAQLLLAPRLRMSGAIPLLPPICLRGVDRDKYGILLKCVCSFSDGISLYVLQDSYLNQQHFLFERQNAIVTNGWFLFRSYLRKTAVLTLWFPLTSAIVP
jgi:hypothetical protein